MDAGRPTVLVVEDEEAIRRFLKTSLEADHIRVILAGTAAQAQASTYRFRPDVTLLDLGLPDMDGVALIPRLREAANNTIIVLTASSQEASKVRALDAGADDYLTKPFGIQVLKARIRVALRHLSTPADPQAGPVISLGDIDIDLVARSVTHDGYPIHLTQKELKLLMVLAKNPGRLITQRALMLEVWGAAYETDTHYLRIYIKNLRRKIERDPSRPTRIVTEVGVGYRLVLDED
jgi:two-component system KDP operon response regulator KdpE